MMGAKFELLKTQVFFKQTGYYTRPFVVMEKPCHLSLISFFYVSTSLIQNNLSEKKKSPVTRKALYNIKQFRFLNSKLSYLAIVSAVWNQI